LGIERTAVALEYIPPSKEDGDVIENVTKLLQLQQRPPKPRIWESRATNP